MVFMALLDWWPTTAQIHDCLQAVQRGDPARIEAVHQSMLLRCNVPELEPGELLRDAELLQQIIDDNNSVAVAIEGASGSGKTHLIHWLTAQWEKRASGAPRRVIVIPGDATAESLAKLLPAIEGPEPPPRKTPQPLEVRELLLRALEVAETAARERLHQAKLAGTTPTLVDRDVGSWLAKGLRDFLGDPVTGQPFFAPDRGAFALISDLLARGVTPGNPEFFRFQERHFTRQEGVDILRAGAAAQQFYKKLNLTSDHFRVSSAELMNEVMAEAFAGFVGPGESEPLPLAERWLQLLSADHETTLILVEGTVETDDLLPQLAKGARWSIQESLSAPHDFVAAYLQAARGDNATIDGMETELLAAFGFSSQGHWLFPYNRAAIEQLLRQTPSTNLPHQPAEIVARLCHELLSKYRDDFATGAFPPADSPDFDHSHLNAEIRQRLEEEYPNDAGRYATLLAFWGGNPNAWEAINVPDALYRAFGLAPVRLVPEPEVIPELTVVAEPVHCVHPEVQAFHNALHAGQAGLDLLTAEVLQWLRDSGQWNDFRLQRISAEDEICCGLS